MSESPLVSVTVCVRDGGHWVDDCLNSLLQQTHRPLEIIAVNDGSSDNEMSDVIFKIVSLSCTTLIESTK